MYSSPVALPRMIRFSKTSPGCLRLDVADRRRVAAVDADAQVDHAVRAERHDRLAGLRVQLLEQVVHREDQALVAAVAAFPVHQAAVGHAVHVLADPQLLAGLRVDGDDRSVPAAAIDHAADDDRIAAGVAVRVSPRHLELTDVGLVDLSRREIARVIGTVAVSRSTTCRRTTAPCRSPPRRRSPRGRDLPWTIAETTIDSEPFSSSYNLAEAA